MRSRYRAVSRSWKSIDERVDERVERLVLVVELLLEDARDLAEELRLVATSLRASRDARDRARRAAPSARPPCAASRARRTPRRASASISRIFSYAARAPSASPTCSRQSAATLRSSSICSRGSPSASARCILTSMTSVHALRRGRSPRGRPSPRSRGRPRAASATRRPRRTAAASCSPYVLPSSRKISLSSSASSSAAARSTSWWSAATSSFGVALTAANRRRSRGAPRGSRSRCRGRGSSPRAPSRRGRACRSVVRARRVRMLTRSSSLDAMSNSRSRTSTSLRPLRPRLVEVRERVERLGVFAAQVEDGLPGLDRAFRLTELVGREVRDLRADLGLGGVARGVLELALVDGVELLPGALLLVDARERRDRAFVRLVELVEDAPVRADRVRQVAEARLVELAEARVELDELERCRSSPARASRGSRRALATTRATGRCDRGSRAPRRRVGSTPRTYLYVSSALPMSPSSSSNVRARRRPMRALDCRARRARRARRRRRSPASPIRRRPPPARRGASSPAFSSSGILLERADVDVERLRRVEQLLFEELGEAVVRREPLFLPAWCARAAPRRRARASPTRPSTGRAARGSRRPRPASARSAKSASRASSVAWCSGAALMTSRYAAIAPSRSPSCV